MKTLLISFLLMILASCTTTTREPDPKFEPAVWAAVLKGNLIEAYRIADDACRDAGAKGVKKLTITVTGDTDTPTGRLTGSCYF